MTFSSRYLNSQIAWVHPNFIARHSCTENEVSSDQTTTENSYATNTKPETKSILTSVTDHTPDHQSPAIVQISSPKVAYRLELQNLACKLLLAETENTKLKQINEQLKTSQLVFSSESANKEIEIDQLKNKIRSLEEQVVDKDTMLEQAKKKFIDFKNRVMSIRTFRH